MRAAHIIDKVPRISAAAAGCLAASALPPVHFWLGLLGFAILLAALDRSRSAGSAFLSGWLFGFTFNLAGLYWIGIAFYADAERFGALAVPAVVLLAAGLALVQGLIGTGYRFLTKKPTPVAARALLLAGLWAMGELIRGDHGLRFPWNPIASAFGNSDALMQPLAWIGPHLMGALTVVAAGFAADLFTREQTTKWRLPVLGLLLLATLWVAGAVRLMTVEPEAASGRVVRVVQANIAQHHKWDEGRVRDWFFSHIELSAVPGEKPFDVIVWPESSVPYRIEEETTRQAILQRMPHDAPLLAGSDYFMRGDAGLELHNSLYVVMPDGEISARYDKVDLVPFGEFLPARPLLAALGLEKLTPGSVDFIPGAGRQTIDIDGMPSFSPLICYEAIFAGRATDGGARPGWLLNVTNDAWFGRSSGPYQHLVMARMRAVEEGLPLVRAANTGISVVTDAFGRLQDRLALGQTGVIDASLPGRLASPPPYKRFGHAISFLGIGLCFVAAGILIWSKGRSSRRSRPA